MTKGLEKRDKVLYDNSLLDGALNVIQKNYKLFKMYEKEFEYNVDEILNNTIHIRDFDKKISSQVNGCGSNHKKFY